MFTKRRCCVALPIGVAAITIANPAAAERAETPLEEARLFFELNDTDGDLGIHAVADSEPWKLLEIEDPRGRRMLAVSPGGKLRLLGLTELTFESAEPSFDELPPADFLAQFPEGVYEISGITVEGDELESKVRLSRLLPGPPSNVRINGMPAAENCDADNVPVVTPPVIITWDPVTRSHPTIGRQGAAQVIRYQVFAEQRGHDPLTFSLDLPPSVTRYQVAPELLAVGDDSYKFEILAREQNGNQTAIENCFRLR